MNPQGLNQREAIQRSATLHRLKANTPAHAVYATNTAMRTSNLLGAPPDFWGRLSFENHDVLSFQGCYDRIELPSPKDDSRAVLQSNQKAMALLAEYSTPSPFDAFDFAQR